MKHNGHLIKCHKQALWFYFCLNNTLKANACLPWPCALVRYCFFIFFSFFFLFLLYFIDVCTTLFVMGHIKCFLRTQLLNNNSLGRIDVNVCAAQILGTTFAFDECLNVVAVLSASTHSHSHFASVLFFQAR